MPETKVCSSGIILSTPKGWLICHPTNSGNRWDFPKGRVEEGENHFTAALRELHEEANVILTLVDIQNVMDLGIHSYMPKKDLHLFYVEITYVPVNLKCNSMVEPHIGNFMEMDDFKFVMKDKVCGYVGRSLKAYLENFVMPILNSRFLILIHKSI